MAKIVIFGNAKGGIGKSTMALLTANALSAAPFKKKVLVIDNDSQKSVLALREYDEEEMDNFPYAVREMGYQEIKKEIVQLDTKYDYILIDTPGRIDDEKLAKDQEITKLLSIVDFVFVPFKGGALNIDATIKYTNVLLDIKALRQKTDRPLKAYGFVNFYRSRALTDKDLEGEIAFLQKNTELEFMKARINQHASFERVDSYSSHYVKGRTSNKAKKNFSTWLNEFVRVTKK